MYQNVCHVCDENLYRDEDGEVTNFCSYPECPHAPRMYNIEPDQELDFNDKCIRYDIDNNDEGC